MTENSRELEERIERLKNISLFKDIAGDNDAIEQIASLFEKVTYNKGSSVVKEGEDGNELYIIKSGVVEVVKTTFHGEPYTVVELSGEMNIFFGEVALLDPDKRSASVICKTDCEFYVLARDKFVKFGNENPYVGLIVTRELSTILCKRLRKANTDIITLFDALVEEVGESGGITAG